MLNSLITTYTEGERKFTDFYYERGVFEGRPLGIEQYRKFFPQRTLKLAEEEVKMIERMRRSRCEHFGHSDGEQLDCDRNTIFNEALDQVIQHLQEFIKFLREQMKWNT